MTKEQILSRLLSNIPEEFDKTVGSFFYDAEAPAAMEFESAYEKLTQILKNGFALTAEGTYLDAKVAEQGLVRKSATFSTVTVTITGIPGSVVSVGDKVASNTLTFSATETVTIPDSGTVSVLVQCDVPGSGGNVPIGTINRFPVTLPNLVSVTNNEPATGGFDEETDDALRERYFEKVSLPATSGSKYHYVMWAKEVDGVGDARCIPLWNGNGTVKVVIINADRTQASDALVKNVADHIEENRPIGADVTVVSATPLTVAVSVTLVLKNNVDLETAKTDIENRITAYLKTSAFSNTYVSYAQIGGCILGCDEVADYHHLTINGGVDNISVAETEVPVLGVMTVVHDE